MWGRGGRKSSRVIYFIETGSGMGLSGARQKGWGIDFWFNEHMF